MQKVSRESAEFALRLEPLRNIDELVSQLILAEIVQEDTQARRLSFLTWLL
jgi:hypothetical protein